MSRLLSFTLLTFVTACSAPVFNRADSVNINEVTSDIKVRTSISGKAEFPDFHSAHSLSLTAHFSSKATITEVAPSATVSIIYTSDYSEVSLRNVTIATGLTNSSGNFTINPSSTFNPAINSVYILEASKRIGDAGNDNMAIRTYIKWNGTGWDSITFPGIYLNTKTTALAIVQNFNKNIVSALDTIGKIDVSGGSSVPLNIGTPTVIESQTVIQVADFVTQVLSVNHDPMEYIKLVNGQYHIVNPADIYEAFPNMVIVQGGTFQMGDNDPLSWGATPVHGVTLSSFYIGKYETTQAEYQSIIGSNPSDTFYANGIGTNKPVNKVSWFDSIAYCNAKSQVEGLPVAYKINGTGCNVDPTACTADLLDASGLVTTDVTKVKGYRLPTEAEWEFAARGGNSSGGYTYSGSNTLGVVAWYRSNDFDLGSTSPDYGLHDSGTKAPNELGLYDMSGNVGEWNWDWYAGYTSSSVTNPLGAVTGTYQSRVFRGGSWSDIVQFERVADRNSFSPDYRNYNLGFRVVRSP